MRKLKLQMQVTLDGFVAGPNWEMDWVTFDWDDQLNQYVTELTDMVDCILLGRKLAEGFIPHWAALPENEDPAGVQQMNDTAKVVFTNTLEGPNGQTPCWLKAAWWMRSPG
jgi:dihydrofolate reductase